MALAASLTQRYGVARWWPSGMGLALLVMVPPVLTLAARVLRPRDLPVLGRRPEEHRHRRARQLPVPEPPRTDEDGARAHGHVRRPVVGQHGDVDLSFERVEQLVAVGMTLPRRQPRVAHDAERALVERCDRP